MIRVENLTLRHIGRRAAALRDLSLDWHRGECLLLLGPSGGGKSTLSLCLNGIIPHSVEAHWEQGRVLVDGHDTRVTGLGRLTQEVGVLFQDPESQMVMLEVDDEIAFGLENLGLPRHEIASRIQTVRDLVGIDARRTPSRLDALSGGTKQRVLLAALLAMGSQRLVLDEPTANLDPQGAHDVLQLLGSLFGDRERSLLLIEHRLDEVVSLVDRVVVLDGSGHVALEGAPDVVFMAHAAALDRIGAWTPELADLALLIDPHSTRVPRSPSEAASRLARAWTASGLFPRDGRTAHLVGPTSGAPLVDIDCVSYQYPHARSLALHDVSLEIHAGEFLALVGANAAGKSTLGLLLAGVLHPTSGAMRYQGRVLREVPEREIRRRLSYVFQYPEHQFVGGTVRDEVLFGLRVRHQEPRAAQRRTQDVLERFGLASLAEASPYTLSHGQKRRLSVATALVTEPEMLILDEPTFGQDRRHTDELMSTLRGLHGEGRTIVVITHDLSLVAEHACRVVALDAGEMLFDGSPHHLFARSEILNRCHLRLPPVAEAFSLARAAGNACPAAISLSEAASVLGPIHDGRSGGV